MSYWLLGGKYDLLRKNANIKGKRCKNGGRGKLSLYLGEKISFWKKVCGAKLSYFGEIYTSDSESGKKMPGTLYRGN